MMFNINNYYKWYFIPKVKFEIIKYTKNRETSLITHDKKITLRMLKIHSVQHIDIHLKAINWFKLKWNMYYSLGKYENGIPNQTLNFRERDNSDWKKNHFKSMIIYDFMVDIDASDHNEIMASRDSALTIVKRFDKFKIPYELRFSGCGFHIIIPYSYFKDKGYSFDPSDKNSIYSAYSLMAKKLNVEYSEMVDVNLNDARRLCKIPYSLAIYEKIIYVCCPISLDQLKDFDIKDMIPENVYQRINESKTN